MFSKFRLAVFIAEAAAISLIVLGATGAISVGEYLEAFGLPASAAFSQPNFVAWFGFRALIDAATSPLVGWFIAVLICAACYRLLAEGFRSGVLRINLGTRIRPLGLSAYLRYVFYHPQNAAWRYFLIIVEILCIASITLAALGAGERTAGSVAKSVISGRVPFTLVAAHDFERMQLFLSGCERDVVPPYWRKLNRERYLALVWVDTSYIALTPLGLQGRFPRFKVPVLIVSTDCKASVLRIRRVNWESRSAVSDGGTLRWWTSAFSVAFMLLGSIGFMGAMAFEFLNTRRKWAVISVVGQPESGTINLPFYLAMLTLFALSEGLIVRIWSTDSEGNSRVLDLKTSDAHRIELASVREPRASPASDRKSE